MQPRIRPPDDAGASAEDSFKSFKFVSMNFIRRPVWSGFL